MTEALNTFPLLAMLAITVATAWRATSVRRTTGDQAWAFSSAKGKQRAAGISFALSMAVLLTAAVLGAGGTEEPAILTAIISLVGSAMVIVAQIQMGRAWRIGVRAGDAPLFVSDGLFRFSRNPIFLGTMMVGLSAAMASGTWWGWVALTLLVASCIAHVQIEEVHLQQSFGEAYLMFRRRVPRWLGPPRPQDRHP